VTSENILESLKYQIRAVVIDNKKNELSEIIPVKYRLPSRENMFKICNCICERICFQLEILGLIR
jgi:hypothetical protein